MTRVDWTAVILAAGKGTRMRSDLAKVLHPLAGRSLLGHVLATAERLAIERTVVIVGHQADDVVRAHARPAGGVVAGPEGRLTFVRQEPQLGTGHAVQMAAEPLRAAVAIARSAGAEAHALVLYGDVPLLRASTLAELMERHLLRGAGVTVLTARVPDPTGYGRVVRDAEGRFARIVEHRDASEEERRIDEINSGIYAFRLEPLLASLDRLRPANAQNELYLTDTLELMAGEGHLVEVFIAADPDEIQGVNTPEQLSELEDLLREREATGRLESCEICEILARRPDLILARDGRFAVLVSPRPYNSGHLWICPERHLVSQESLTPAEASAFWDWQARVEGWLEAAYEPKGLNSGFCSGRPGEHLAAHAIPRWPGDSNFLPLVAGLNLLPETLIDTRSRVAAARARLESS